MIKIQEEKLKNYISEISSGNETALEQFYDEYGRLLFALIFSIVKNKESSEEVLQDVLMAIVNCYGDKPIENARGWLFKVIENISKKKISENKSIQIELLSDEDEILSDYDITSGIENAVDQIEALKILDESEQEILIMCVFAHMKLPYVAKTLNMPYNKVRSKYNYAISKLKKYYREGRKTDEQKKSNKNVFR